MKKYFIKNSKSFIIILLYVIYCIFSYLTQNRFSANPFDYFGKTFKDMISFLPAIFVLIGLFDVWVPRSIVEKHTGNESGMISCVWLILLAMLQAGPLYGAFPVTYVLWSKGTSIRNIFIYIGAFCILKIPMLTFEISFLGLKFSLLRTILSLPVIFIIAIIMDKMFKKKFKISEG